MKSPRALGRSLATIVACTSLAHAQPSPEQPPSPVPMQQVQPTPIGVGVAPEQTPTQPAQPQPAPQVQPVQQPQQVAPPQVGGCTMDRDCKGDRICEAGRCVAPHPATTTTTTPAGPVAEADAPAKDSVASLFVNVLGLLQFGVTPTLELGKRAAFQVKGLFMNTGAASYLIAGDDTLHFSWGIGPGFRYYFGTNGSMRGTYIGAIVMYVAWESQYKQETLYNTTLVAPLFEAGYRWVFRGGFSVGVGGTAGPGLVVDKSSKAVGNNTPHANTGADRAIAFLHLDLGFLL